MRQVFWGHVKTGDLVVINETITGVRASMGAPATIGVITSRGYASTGAINIRAHDTYTHISREANKKASIYRHVTHDDPFYVLEPYDCGVIANVLSNCIRQMQLQNLVRLDVTRFEVNKSSFSSFNFIAPVQYPANQQRLTVDLLDACSIYQFFRDVSMRKE